MSDISAVQIFSLSAIVLQKAEAIFLVYFRTKGFLFELLINKMQEDRVLVEWLLMIRIQIILYEISQKS